MFSYAICEVGHFFLTLLYYLTEKMSSVFVPSDSSCWVNGTVLIQKLQ